MNGLLYILIQGGLIYNYQKLHNIVFLVLSGVAGYFLVPGCILFWIALGVLLIFTLAPKIREQLITKRVYNFLKNNNVLPQISKTEEEALNSGTKWIAGEFFSGQPNFRQIYNRSYNKLTNDEQSFLDNQVETLCSMVTDWDIFQQRDMPKEAWEYLKKEKFFGMIIPKEYGGLGFTALGHSAVIEKLVSRSQVLAITTMVPNSLGPAELLIHYGTTEQKDKYLNKLATGEEIPCFGLTEPLAGSDAASITSTGEIIKEGGKVKILLNYEKRYITLGNIATVIGLAFKLRDPNKILGKGEDLGITFALIDGKTKGVDSTKRLDPLGVPFYNSHLVGKDVKISMDDVIGAEAGIGQGWKMLMGSLSVGRGISLPSTSLGASKLATRVVAGYSVAREQFGLSIGKFEGIQEQIGKIVGLTYMQKASEKFVLDAIDSGEKPAVLNSVMKYHSTENSREVIKSAMDVLGGAGIIKGEKNLLGNLYIGAPISITVEGANILTRNLMQYGQGVIRCHPHIKDEIDGLTQGDVSKFDKALFSHITLGISNGVRSIFLYLTRGYFVPIAGDKKLRRYEQKIVWASAFFSLYSDIALGVFGGGLKKKENISSKLADIFSHLYLASSILREYKEKKDEKELLSGKWALEYCLYNIQKSSESFIENMFDGLLGKVMKAIPLTLLRINPIGYYPSDTLSRKLSSQILEDIQYKDSLTKGIFIPKNEKEQLAIIDKAHTLYKQTKDLVKKAKSGEILSKEEESILSDFRKVQYEAITVDSFDVKEYFKQR
ncbi:MAG: acyl-CoA dehydrogenase [Campylobacterales bacterium]|nr:acyl-CoA dehydrogenase [Campylobacterales bacterium]